jgi:uncharacterized protein YjiS (DUF1127 family)
MHRSNDIQTDRTKTMTLLNLASSLSSSLKRYSSYRTAVRQLESLDDRQLADIGVSRSRIPELARGGQR